MKTDFVVRELTTEELKDRLDTERAELHKMRLNHAICFHGFPPYYSAT